VLFFGLYRGDGTATADSLFGRCGNNPYSHYRVPERGTHERTLMLGCVIALRYLGRLGVKSAVFTMRRLPVFPNKQTFSQADGMSQTCQSNGHGRLFDHLVGAGKE
jgi:hypothetical protein